MSQAEWRVVVPWLWDGLVGSVYCLAWTQSCKVLAGLGQNMTRAVDVAGTRMLTIKVTSR
jgi:hypothetical protein